MPVIVPSDNDKNLGKRSFPNLYLFVFGYVIGLASYTFKLASMGFQGNRFTYILVLVVITLLLLRQFVSAEVKEKVKRYKAIIIISLSLGLVYYLFGPNLQAKFGIIDDSQIVEYIGPDNHMSMLEIPQLLLNTEVGNPVDTPRYRPSYFTILIVETFLWGKNPFLWYLTRLGIAISFMSALWYLLQKFIGFVPASLFVTFIFTFTFWADIFARLGPAEVYASLGTAMFALGFISLLQNQEKSTSVWQSFINWALVTLGILICIGSKENFLFIILPFLWLLYLAFRNKRGRFVASVSSVLVLSYSALIIWAVGAALNQPGIAIRAQSVSFSSRWGIFLAAINSTNSHVMIVFGILVGVVLCYAQFIRHDKQLGHFAFIALKMLASCYFLFVSQFVFYNGNWPIGNRYDFPGVLYKPFLYLILAWFLIKALQTIKIPPQVHQGLVAGFIVGLTLIIFPGNFVQIRDMSIQNMRNTQAFTARLNLVLERLERNPDAAMVIESHQVFDYEPIYAWVTYLEANGIANPIFLRLHTYSSATAASDFERRLTEGLEKTAREGRRGISSIQFLGNYSDNCFSLQLSGSTVTECTDIE